jgi:hypothetical protein
MTAHIVSRSTSLLLWFVFLLFSQQFLSALGQNAEIAGTVTDPSKAVIPNASIEIIETATQVKWDTLSNGDGRYVAPSLAPGVYRITVQAPTFEAQVVGNLRLHVESKVSLDFVLHPGAVSQSVTVDGSGIHLNTTDASVSTVIDRRLIENLPLNGRSFQSLMTLAPGVLVVPSQGVGQSGELSVNGQRTESNYFTVNGVSADIGASVSSSGFTTSSTNAWPKAFHLQGSTAVCSTPARLAVCRFREPFTRVVRPASNCCWGPTRRSRNRSPQAPSRCTLARRCWTLWSLRDGRVES